MAENVLLMSGVRGQSEQTGQATVALIATGPPHIERLYWTVFFLLSSTLSLPLIFLCVLYVDEVVFMCDLKFKSHEMDLKKVALVQCVSLTSCTTIFASFLNHFHTC